MRLGCTDGARAATLAHTFSHFLLPAALCHPGRFDRPPPAAPPRSPHPGTCKRPRCRRAPCTQPGTAAGSSREPFPLRTRQPSRRRQCRAPAVGPARPGASSSCNSNSSSGSSMTCTPNLPGLWKTATWGEGRTRPQRAPPRARPANSTRLPGPAPPPRTATPPLGPAPERGRPRPRGPGPPTSDHAPASPRPPASPSPACAFLSLEPLGRRGGARPQPPVGGACFRSWAALRPQRYLCADAPGRRQSPGRAGGGMQCPRALGLRSSKRASRHGLGGGCIQARRLPGTVPLGTLPHGCCPQWGAILRGCRSRGEPPSGTVAAPLGRRL